PLAELVALMNGCDAEVARVGAAAAGFDDYITLVDQRQRVSIERDEIPRRVGHGGEPAKTAMRSVRHDRAAGTPRQTVDVARPFHRIKPRELKNGVLRFADEHPINLRRTRHRQRWRGGGVRAETEDRRAVLLLQPRDGGDVSIE